MWVPRPRACSLDELASSLGPSVERDSLGCFWARVSTNLTGAAAGCEADALKAMQSSAGDAIQGSVGGVWCECSEQIVRPLMLRLVAGAAPPARLTLPLVHSAPYRSMESLARSLTGHRDPVPLRSPPGRLRSSVIVAASSGNKAAELRRLLNSPGIHLGPCAHDGLSARLIERSGLFQFCFMVRPVSVNAPRSRAVQSGFCVSATQLGAPDAGLISCASARQRLQALKDSLVLGAQMVRWQLLGA